MRTLLLIFCAFNCIAAPGEGARQSALSDTFTALPDARWTGGLRGYNPGAMEVVPGGLIYRTQEPENDSYWWADDMVMSFPTPCSALKCSIVLRMTIPPFGDWPVDPVEDGTFHYFGVRCTVRNAAGDLWWPGIMLELRDGVPWFSARTVSSFWARPIKQAGPWTLGLAWDDAGRTQYYAAPGYVALQASDLIYTDNDGSAASEVTGNFLCLRIPLSQTEGLTTPWLLNALDVFKRGNRAPLPSAPPGGVPPL